MTCFWSGLLGCLHQYDFRRIGILRKPSIRNFVTLLKSRNKITENVLWQDTKLTDKFKKECFEAVKELNVNSINNGYLCSTDKIKKIQANIWREYRLLERLLGRYKKRSEKWLYCILKLSY